MRFTLPTELKELAAYLPEFMAFAGVERWMKRADQLADEMERSPYLHRIVLDYHWFEMNVCHQWQFFTQQGDVDLRSIPELQLAALNFAAAAVEVHKRLGDKGKRVLTGRILDALKAENGFAALYLELSLVQRLLTWGFDIELPDMEGTGQFDLLISQGEFSAEIECKSQSADAGRQIHRKHFYRFMDMLRPEMPTKPPAHWAVVLVTLSGRLSADLKQQALLGDAVKRLVDSGTTTPTRCVGSELALLPLSAVPGLEQSINDAKAIEAALKGAFGHNIHVATWPRAGNGYLLVMQSKKEDDPSTVTLEAMRKGASQLTKTRPSFLALQEHGMAPSDLYLRHVQERIEILSNMLFGHYRVRHVNAVYVTAYAAVANDQHTLRTPGFAVLNMLAKRKIPQYHSDALLRGILQEQPPVEPSPT